MSYEPLDISDAVNIFSLGLVSNVSTDEEGMFTHTFKANPIELEMTYDGSLWLQTIHDLYKSETVMKMTDRGRFWFDTWIEADVIMTDMKIEEDGSFTAIYKSINLIDHTNYGKLARFLRWILKR